MNQLKNKIFCGGNLEVVKSWPSNFISAIVTDPPYGLGFMGKEWDTLIEKTRDSAGGFLRDGKSGSNPYAAARCRHGSDSLQMQEWYYHWAKAMLRITKPGGFLLCFGGTRTYHRLACAIEDAGWEIRDCMMWLYGSGFPKSHNISKAIDKAAGAKRKIVGQKDLHRGSPIASQTTETSITGWNKPDYPSIVDITVPATSLAQLWEGYGTALKPAWEPIIVAMKPLDGTFAHNAEAHGVAGLNIDAGRIPAQQGDRFGGGGLNSPHRGFMAKTQNTYKKGTGFRDDTTQGRWPANLILDEEAGAMLDEQSGISKSQGISKHRGHSTYQWSKSHPKGTIEPQYGKEIGFGDVGGASRFFYCAKCSKRERNMGLDDQSGKKVNDGRDTPIDNPYQRGETVRKNTHPTVKPLALMKYLCTLLKMPSADQIILDPFLGSGTTGITCKELGINFIGIEKDREYCEIAVKRIAAVGGVEITLHSETPKPTPPVSKVPLSSSESRQRAINEASAALRRNQK